MAEIDVRYADSSMNLGSVQTRHLPYQDNTIVAPNHPALRNEQVQGYTHAHRSYVSQTPNAIEQSTRFTSQFQRQTLAPHDAYAAHAQPPRETRRARQPIDNPLHDGSTPYIPGRATGRNDKLQHMTDILTNVVEGPSFACDKCARKCKTKAGLKYVQFLFRSDPVEAADTYKAITDSRTIPTRGEDTSVRPVLLRSGIRKTSGDMRMLSITRCSLLVPIATKCTNGRTIWIATRRLKVIARFLRLDCQHLCLPPIQRQVHIRTVGASLLVPRP